MTFVGVFPSQAVFDRVVAVVAVLVLMVLVVGIILHLVVLVVKVIHTHTSRPNLKISQGCIPAVHHWWKLARDVRPPQSLYEADFTMDFFQERFPFVDGCTTGPSWLFFSLSLSLQNSPETWACFSAAETCSWAVSKKHTTFFFKGRSIWFSGGSPFGIPGSFFKCWTNFCFSNVHHLSDTGMFWQVPPVSREWWFGGWGWWVSWSYLNDVGELHGK